IWEGIDDADAIDAQHTREDHAYGETKTGMQFGSVEAKRHDLDADPSRFGFGNRQLADLQVLYGSWCAEHHRSHARCHTKSLTVLVRSGRPEFHLPRGRRISRREPPA